MTDKLVLSYLQEFIDNISLKGEYEKATKMATQSLKDGHINTEEYDMLIDIIQDNEYNAQYSPCCGALITDEGRCSDCGELVV